MSDFSDPVGLESDLQGLMRQKQESVLSLTGLWWVGSGGVGGLQIKECQVFLGRKKREVDFLGRDKEQTSPGQEFPLPWVFARLLEGERNMAVV